MNSDFDRAMGFAIFWETAGDAHGGYTNDPDDPGGETKWGVSRGTYPDLDIKNLTLEQAKGEVYFPDYWLGSGQQKSFCDRLPSPLNRVHFDCVINIGNWKVTKSHQPLFHGRANMILQRALGVDDDGLIGPLTLSAVVDANQRALVTDAIAKRDDYYRTRGHWALKYINGWLNRTRALSTEVIGELPNA